MKVESLFFRFVYSISENRKRGHYDLFIPFGSSQNLWGLKKPCNKLLKFNLVKQSVYKGVYFTCNT